ncbi:MAG: Putative PAS/PAC sensor protein [Thermotoga sp. 50_1627]|uniref:DUF438 domain-containing protein n=1 Tax=Pseudothermotoga sp. TaxID=2033661 RepID=UPI00076C9BE1|nr:MAG: Putative PAS/PAC sensor protein [Thermotoga sp. 50_64]KUK24938.1 MAG: Putative PAS/PAC sensor protein [Thermotoga sp. 50_1627]MBC7116671.1 DUF438 domain-containing protein [Pseudothermotoga sp.]MDK2922745.1 uncharacterized protein [Pseudothermotoga sp.]HBT39292.1 DUF438 domain-containing protein [Pseudothermotoga sp.]
MERQEKIEIFKTILKRLHQGEDIETLKKEFGEIIASLPPFEIPAIEQELLKEGEITVRDIVKMCDLHVELFRGAVSEAGREIENLPSGHPLRSLYEENRQILKDSEVLSLLSSSAFSVEDGRKSEFLKKLKELLVQMRKIGFTHYTREEMLVFPYLERRGITAVPTVLWSKHDEIRLKMKLVLELLENQNSNERLKKEMLELSQMVADMVFRENNILYPTLKVLLSEGEWVAIKIFEEEIGYYGIEVKNEWQPSQKPLLPFEIDPRLDEETFKKMPEEVKRVAGELKPDTYQIRKEGDHDLQTGFLNREELIALLKTLPLDVTFIDSNDRVRFFSHGRRIFHRAPTVIGRMVQFCHPPRSVHIVNRILQSFKEGRKDVAEFWINLAGRLVHIRYFPVRNEEGKYLGTLELVQEVTEIKKLEGEKRLLDWKD